MRGTARRPTVLLTAFISRTRTIEKHPAHPSFSERRCLQFQHKKKDFLARTLPPGDYSPKTRPDYYCLFFKATTCRVPGRGVVWRCPFTRVEGVWPAQQPDGPSRSW